MPDSRLQLKIEGPGVAPETVSLRDLLDLLDSYEQAIQATASANRNSAGDAIISLVEVGVGSDVLTLKASANAMRAAEVIGKAITSRDCSRLPMKAEECLRQMWRK